MSDNQIQIKCNRIYELLKIIPKINNNKFRMIINYVIIGILVHHMLINDN